MRLNRYLPLLLIPMTLTRCVCDPADGITGLPGAIIGTLCDIRTGVGGRRVELAITTDNGSSMRAESENGGQLRLEDVPPGVYDVVISQDLGDRQDVRTVRGVEVKSTEDTTVLDPACIGARNPPGTGWVTGKVCNRHTGSWVNSAEVVIQLSSGDLLVTTTDSEGGFLLEAVPVGTHVMTVRSTTFMRSYEVVVVEGRETALESPAACVGVDPNSGGVEGNMCAPNGTGPLSGAVAYIDVGTPPVRISDTTDANGAFILTGIPPGMYDLHIELGSYHRTYPVVITPNAIARIGASQCVEPDPTTTGRIEGNFCGPSGGPLTGAAVTVNVSGGVLEDTTDQTGSFTFAGVEPGSHTVTVTHVSLNQSYPVTVTAGQVTTLNPTGLCTVINPNGEVGEIHGRMCAPNGTTWLANARVWVDTASGAIETQTDSQGRFALQGVPEGTYVVHVQAGSFTTDIPNVVVVGNEITSVGDSAEACTPIEDNHRIAVVTGDYDSVETVLGRLGLTNITLFTGEDGSFQYDLLEDYQRMQEFDVIFFNCGLDDAFLSGFGGSTAIANLRAYVESGRSIYASDWAYDLVEVGWPSYIDFLDEDSLVDSAQLGMSELGMTATVVDPALRNALGQQSVTINYDLPGWAVMTGASSAAQVYVRGNASVCSDAFFCDTTQVVNNVPFTVGFHPSPNAGKVIYTSFHQEQQSTEDMDMILNLLVFEL